ncbi:MAG: TonB-dependent receptor [Saprospiraceae bacterium]|nr:TonB-dependent receptor [Saprospiraceae bacterium]MBK7738718.1 TonB-dependent receptor [Saprospiraceae bacterium]MBK7912710.1 TonB-dependent receptor [Saprospiraceae bacterium]
MKTNVILFLLLLFSELCLAQNRQITGTVRSAKDQTPLVGASVLIKGSNTGTVSDIDGSFRLEVGTNATLICRYIGYVSQELAINNQTSIEIQLAEDLQLLSEIIVTGYGTQTKRDLTGAISKIRQTDVRDIPANSVEQLLQGTAAGVQVNAGSGKLGQAMQIRVRGNSSVSASNEPLYVVDGIPITTANLSATGYGATNSLVDLNPEDIESVEILKDASAAAIYGSRGSNGVVLITTKKGHEGKTSINFTIQSGSAEAAKKVKFLNAAQYVDYYTKAAANSDRIDGIDSNDPDSYTSYIKGFFDAISAGTYGTADQADTQWDELGFQNAPQTQVDLSIDGGNAKTKFYTSGQYLDQTGIMKGNQLTRFSGRIGVDHEANAYLTIGLNMGLSRLKNKRISYDNNFDTPLQIIALTPLTPLKDPSTGLLIGTPPGDINLPLYYNPLINIGNAFHDAIIHRNLSSAYAALKICKGLTFRSEFGIDLLNQQEESYFNSKTQRNQGQEFGYGFNQFNRVENYNFNNFLNYQKEFDIHQLDLILGTSYQQSELQSNNVSGSNFPSDAYKKISSAAEIIGGTSTETNFRFVSYFARANYKLMNRFLASVSGRVDGSSRFGADNRYGFFPAASLGWVVSDESFMSSVSPISFLKIRTSYGRTGNAEIGNLPQLGLFSGDAGYGGQAGQRPSQLANPDLKWETTDQVDLGIDFGFLKDRITGELDLYRKSTSGLLLNVNVPATTGFTSQVKNVGKLENKGIEFVLNAVVLDRPNLKWIAGFNVAANRNKINDIQGQIIEAGFNSMSRAMEGQSMCTFFTAEYAGVDPTNGDALWYKNTLNPDGSLDRTKTADYSEAQRVVIGSALPKWIGGISSTLKFKRFELNMLWNFVQGNLINFYGIGQYASANGLYEDNQTIDQLNSWTIENPNTDIPEARLYYTNGSEASSRYLKDGSFLRLRSASLSYNLPASLSSKARIRNVRLFITGLNLITITKYHFWDPEVNSDALSNNNIAQGYDFYTAPVPRTIVGGINLQF